jgi:hypothetical protein
MTLQIMLKILDYHISIVHDTPYVNKTFSNCGPILTYAAAVREFSSKEMLQCNVAINDAIRKIFSFHRWTSTRELREGLGYRSIYEIFAHAQRHFLKNFPITLNGVLCHLKEVLS